MICPLILAGIFASPGASGVFEKASPNCQEDQCAWWDENEERCCVPQLARELDRLVDRVNDVELMLRVQLENLNQNIFKG
jgi:hypothetical protein